MSAAPQSIRLKAEHRQDRDEHDWYQEPIEATNALLRTEVFDGDIYDPACGEGNVVKACLGVGIEAFGSDIVDRAAGRFWMLDFLDDSAPGYVLYPVDNIVTNPPYAMLELLWADEVASAAFRLKLPATSARCRTIPSIGDMASLREIRTVVATLLRERRLNRWEEAFWRSFDAPSEIAA